MCPAPRISGNLLLWYGFLKFYVLSSPEMAYLVHVKEDFIVVLKMYVLVILGRFVWTTSFEQCALSPSYLLYTLKLALTCSHTIMENSTNKSVMNCFSDENLTCPIFSDSDEKILEYFGFWIEGITQVSIASIGMFFNLISLIILGDKEMRNRWVWNLICDFWSFLSCFLNVVGLVFKK